MVILSALHFTLERTFFKISGGLSSGRDVAARSRFTRSVLTQSADLSFLGVFCLPMLSMLYDALQPMTLLTGWWQLNQTVKRRMYSSAENAVRIGIARLILPLVSVVTCSLWQGRQNRVPNLTMLYASIYKTCRSIPAFLRDFLESHLRFRIKSR